MEVKALQAFEAKIQSLRVPSAKLMTQVTENEMVLKVSSELSAGISNEIETGNSFWVGIFIFLHPLTSSSHLSFFSLSANFHRNLRPLSMMLVSSNSWAL